MLILTKQSADKTTLPGKYIGLRNEATGNHTGVMFDSLVINENSITINSGKESIEVVYDSEKKLIIHDGLEFDSVCFYSKGPQCLSYFSIRIGNENSTKNDSWGDHVSCGDSIEEFEWFPQDRIDYLPEDWDYDEMKSHNFVEGTAFLVE